MSERSRANWDMPEYVEAHAMGERETAQQTNAFEDDEPSSVPEGTLDAWSAPLRQPVRPKVLSTDDFYALLRIIEVLPIADPFLTDLQSKLSDEERRQHGNRASHLSGPEFVREIDRIEALIQARLVVAGADPVPPQVCQWRAIGRDECAPTCGGGGEEIFSRYVVQDWKACPYCRGDVALVPAEGEQ